MVRSPVDGTVKQLFINTVGGVAKPGMDIIEIVPNDDRLLIEAKIKPSDIAFIYPGQNAVVKLTAYDFAIYGGLKGKVIHVSADTITDEKDEEYYLVRIETDKNYLGTEDNKKDIMVGMTVQADIITGKKTILQYIMKPILRAKYNALRER
jgi:adhesin transport system membrane fusion protein